MESPSSWRRFFSELKRRRVYKVAAAYLAVAFVALQAVSLLVPSTTLPVWTDEFLIALAVLGFPLALLLAWAFELTPEGVRRAPTFPDGGASTSASGQSRWLARPSLLIGSVLIAGLVLGGYLISSSYDTDGEEVPPIRSLAVLPLQNLSGDPDQEYFTDGMTEALIAELGQIEALKVISRTSAMRYRDTDRSMPDIARELDVRGLIEGSVLWAGEKIRITVQLIDGPTDRQLWSESYERGVSDVLALQSDVALAIAEEIHVALAPAEESRLTQRRSVSPEAVQAYAKARFLVRKVTPEAHAGAYPLIAQAIAADASWSAPYALLAEWHVMSSYYGTAAGTAEMKAKQAALEAIRRDSLSADGHIALGVVRDYFEWDWDGAERAYRRGLELNPGHVRGHVDYCTLLSLLGRSEAALRHARRAVELDPVSNLPRGQLSLALNFAGRHEEAAEVAREAIAMDPTYDVAYYRLAWALFDSGRPEEAVATVERVLDNFPAGSDPRRDIFVAEVYAHAGYEDEARALLVTILKADSLGYSLHSPASVASIYVGLGEKVEAMKWLQRAYQARDPNLLFEMVRPRTRPVRDEPVFRTLARQLRVPEAAWN